MGVSNGAPRYQRMGESSGGSQLRSPRGYGWQTTLSLLSPFNTAIPDSRESFKMVICPACHSVHEEGGVCTSSRHESMNSFVFDTPATAIGNLGPLELHARTIQQLIAANLTLAAAWTWIQELMTANDTGNVTSYPLVVTGEVYTLGFDTMVLNVLANVTVENSGNSSEPPPAIRDVSFWESAWNSFTGLLSAAWNAVVAVATFVANIALAVIKWCIDFAVAIANGEGLTFFYNTVVKPFVEAVLAFVKWIVDLISAIISSIVNLLFSPIINALISFGTTCANSVWTAIHERLIYGEFTGTATAQLRNTLFGNVFEILVIVGVALSIALFILTPFIGWMSFILKFIAGFLVSLIVAIIAGYVSEAIQLDLGGIFGGEDEAKGPSQARMLGVLDGEGIPQSAAQDMSPSETVGDISTVLTLVSNLFTTMGTWIFLIGILKHKVIPSGITYLIISAFFILIDLIMLVTFDYLENSLPSGNNPELKLQRSAILAAACVSGIIGAYAAFAFAKSPQDAPAGTEIFGIVALVLGIFGLVFSIVKLWAYALGD